MLDSARERLQEFAKKWDHKYSPILSQFFGDDPDSPDLIPLRSRWKSSGFFGQMDFAEKPEPLRKNLTRFGSFLKRVSEVKRASADVIERADRLLRQNKVIEGFKKTPLQEHQTMSLNETEHGMLRPEKGSFGFLFPLVAKEPEHIATIQNKYIARTLFETFKNVGRTGSDKSYRRDKLIPTLTSNVDVDAQGSIVDVDSSVELKGYPVRIRILRGNPPVDFVDVVFNDPNEQMKNVPRIVGGTKDAPVDFVYENEVTNHFAQIDYLRYMKSEISASRDMKSTFLEISSSRPLSEWHRVELQPRNTRAVSYDHPDIVLGPGSHEFQMDGFMSDFQPQMYLEVGQAIDRVATMGVYANNHFARNGSFFVGNGVDHSNPSLHEKVMSDTSLTDLLDTTPESKDLALLYIEQRGEFQPRTISLFSYLSDRHSTRLSDQREKIEKWLGLNSFQSESLREFALETAGVHRVQTAFQLPTLLNELSRKVPKMPVLEKRGIKSIILNALAFYRATGRMTGIDVEILKPRPNGIDMQTIGWDIVEDLEKVIEKIEKRELDSETSEFTERYPDLMSALLSAAHGLSVHLDEVRDGKNAGSIQVNRDNGILQPLEILATKYGAAIIPGLLRVGQHYSKLISKAVGGMPVIFRSALGADGTGKNIAQLNDIYMYEATLDNHFEVIDILLPYIRGNTYVRSSFVRFLASKERIPLNEFGKIESRDLRKAKRKYRKAIEMMTSDDYECFTDLQHMHDVTWQVQREKPMQLYGHIWGGDYGHRRYLMGADSEIRHEGKKEIESFVTLFNEYSRWIRNLDVSDPGVHSMDRIAQPLVSHLSEGGFDTLWKKNTEYTVAKFKYEVANVLLAFASSEKRGIRTIPLRSERKRLLTELQKSHQALAHSMVWSDL